MEETKTSRLPREEAPSIGWMKSLANPRPLDSLSNSRDLPELLPRTNPLGPDSSVTHPTIAGRQTDLVRTRHLPLLIACQVDRCGVKGGFDALIAPDSTNSPWSYEEGLDVRR